MIKENFFNHFQYRMIRSNDNKPLAMKIFYISIYFNILIEKFTINFDD